MKFLTKSFPNHLLGFLPVRNSQKKMLIHSFTEYVANTNLSHSLAVGNNEKVIVYNIGNSNKIVEYFSLKGSIAHL